MAAPVSNVTLDVVERNDPEIPLALTHNGVALNLTDCTVEVYFKDAEGGDDGTPLSSATGEVVIEDAVEGTCTLLIPSTALPAKATRTWRVDVVDAEGKRHTCIVGALNVAGI